MNRMHRKRTSFHSFYMPNTKTKPKINKHQRIKPKITQIPTITTQKIQQNLPKKAQSDQHGNKKKKTDPRSDKPQTAPQPYRRGASVVAAAAPGQRRRRRPSAGGTNQRLGSIDLSEEHPTATIGAKLAPSASPRLAQPLSPSLK